MRKTLVIFIVALITLLQGCGGGGSKNPETPLAEIPKYTVTASASNGGSISPKTVEVEQGKNTSFNITLDEKYIISAVSGCEGTLADNTYTTGAITAACEVTASFSYVNQRPMVNAGVDQTVAETDTVTLTGAASDADGTVASYQWQQTSGTSVSLSTSTELTTNFTIPAILASETLTFTLTATDDSGEQSVDSIAINVNHINLAPIVNAGVDQTVAETDTVTLTGAASDADGTVASYQWQQTSGTSVSLNTSTELTTSFTIPTILTSETLTFTLTATDDLGLESTDTIAISVNHINLAPIVNAGVDQVVAETDIVTLTGAASDADGTVASYQWQQTSGTSVSLNTSTELTTSFTIPTILTSETLTFTLTATDDLGLESTDTIAISVNHINLAPIVNAGVDQVVAETDIVTLTGAASDADGTVASYQWQQTSGTSVSLNTSTELTTSFSIPTILASETLTFTLTATDDLGLSSTDTIAINVNHINIFPTLTLGDDISVSEKTVLTLTSESNDIDGEITQYQWQQTSGDALTLTSTNNSTLTFTTPDLSEEKTAIFQLTITDSAGATAMDTIIVTIINDSEAPENVTLVSLTALSESSFNVDWLETNDNLSSTANIKYTIHVSEQIGFIPTAANSKKELTGTVNAELTGYNADTTYYAIIAAEDQDNNISYSNQMSVTTMATAVVENNSQTVHEVATLTTTNTLVEYNLEANEAAPQVGEIIVSPTDNGVLRKITAVTVTNDQVTVDTENAALNDVYEELSLQTSIKLVDIPDSESIPASKLNKMKSSGLQFRKSITKSGNQINELNWKKSGLQLKQETPRTVNKSNSNAFTQKSTAQVNISASSTNAASTDNVQEIKDVNLKMTGPLRVAFMPGKRGTFTISATVINDSQDDYKISELEFDELSHNKIASTVANYGAKIVETTYGTDNNKRDLSLYWTTNDSQIDTNTGQPYIATFKANVEERDCNFSCNKGSATISVKIYVGDTSIPKLTSVEFSQAGAITISGDAGFKFEPKIDVAAKISYGSLKSAHAVVNGHLDFDANLQVTANVEGEVHGSKEFVKKSFVKILSVGAAPVIVRGEFTLTGEFNATATGELNLSHQLNVGFDFSSGFKYVDGKWVGVKDSTPSLSYKLTGNAKAEAYAELRLVPELKLYFYEFAAGHIKVEPYIYAEAGIEGEFVGIAALETGVDISNDYRFTKLNAGIGMDLKLRAGFEIFDKSILGWPDNNLDHFNNFTVLNKTPIFGLPVISINERDDVDITNSCNIDIQASIATVTLPFTDNKTLNDWQSNSAGWSLFPSGNTDNITVQTNGLTSNVQALLTTSSEYRLRFSGHSELGSWANQYQDIIVDFRDENNDFMPDFWADKYKVSSPYDDADNDGLSNKDEFTACTMPNDKDTDNDGMEDGWEVSNNLVPTIDDAIGDTDNDNRNNLSEFLDGTDPNVVDENPIPEVSAGESQVVNEQTLVTLKGTATDGEGTIVSVLWQQVSGEDVILSQSNLLETTFMSPTLTEVTTLSFKLTATDNSNAQSESVISIVVKPVNIAPVANAGTNVEIVAGLSVELDASESMDSDGEISTYLWQVLNEQTLNLVDSESEKTTFVAPYVAENTSYEIQLTVTDNEGATDTDTVTIMVTNAIKALVFSDAKLATCVIATAQSNNWLNPDDITTLDCSNKNITDATGIAQLSELSNLDLSNNQLTSIDLANNIKLTQLNLDNNQLTTIDFTNNTLLQTVTLLNNNFTQNTLNYLAGITRIENLTYQNPIIATGKLNDTGITTCADATTNNLSCPVSDFARQDAQYGRDAQAAAGTLTKVGAGSGGFDFTKLDANGNTLPASATEWSCVKDNHTGLVWEVKTDDSGLQDKDNTYTWYNPNSNINGGDAGTENGGNCPNTGNCDTEKYVNSVNALNQGQGLCGATDWRLPNREELRSIVDYGRFDPMIDSDYFPNTRSYWYWSSSPYYYDNDHAWGVSFLDGIVASDNNPDYVRLVRGGQ